MKVDIADGYARIAEWINVNASGQPPLGRIGHTMDYLKLSNSLIIVGGRNDSLCSKGQFPFLGDIYLYSFDSSSWIKINSSSESDRFSRLFNHCMAVIRIGDDSEKVLVFGGLATKHTKTKSFYASQAAPM